MLVPYSIWCAAHFRFRSKRVMWAKTVGLRSENFFFQWNRRTLECATNLFFRSKRGQCERKPFRLEPKKIDFAKPTHSSYICYRSVFRHTYMHSRDMYGYRDTVHLIQNISGESTKLRTFPHDLRHVDDFVKNSWQVINTKASIATMFLSPIHRIVQWRPWTKEL